MFETTNVVAKESKINSKRISWVKFDDTYFCIQKYLSTISNMLFIRLGRESYLAQRNVQIGGMQRYSRNFGGKERETSTCLSTPFETFIPFPCLTSDVQQNICPTTPFQAHLSTVYSPLIIPILSCLLPTFRMLFFI
jgi:hypothetical protein